MTQSLYVGQTMIAQASVDLGEPIPEDEKMQREKAAERMGFDTVEALKDYLLKQHIAKAQGAPAPVVKRSKTMLGAFGAEQEHAATTVRRRRRVK